MMIWCHKKWERWGRFAGCLLELPRQTRANQAYTRYMITTSTITIICIYISITVDIIFILVFAGWCCVQVLGQSSRRLFHYPLWHKRSRNHDDPDEHLAHHLLDAQVQRWRQPDNNTTASPDSGSAAPLTAPGKTAPFWWDIKYLWAPFRSDNAPF